MIISYLQRTNMTFRIVIAILLAALMSSGLHAQDSLRYSAVSVGTGVRQVLNKDKFQSPYTYKGIDPSFNVGYLNVTPKRKHSLDLGYTTGKIESAVSPKANNQLLTLDYDYLLNVTPAGGNKRFSFFAGPGIQAFMSSTNYLPGVEMSGSYLSAAAYLSLNGEAVYHPGNRSRLELKVSVPVGGFVYRPDFEVNGESMTKASVIGNSLLLNAGLQYVYQLKSDLSIIASYQFNYFQFDEPRAVNVLWHGLSIRLCKRF